MQIPEPWFSRVVKPFVFVACLLPLAWLVWGVWQDALGANPIEKLTRSLGEWSLRFLLLTLLVTTLRRALNWAQVLRLRRMLGLYAFFLCGFALAELFVVGSVLRLGGNRARFIQTPFHYHWDVGVCADDSPCCHFV